jgi:biopolymer transport protein ExbD
MSIKGSGFSRKSGSGSEIPTSSMADIAFLLLVFFMVTTVFRKERNRPIEWVDAAATEKIDEKRKNIVHIWIERNGDVYINDRLIPYEDISEIIRPIYADNRELVIAVRGDREVPYRQINLMTEELQQAGAVRVTFATRLEQRATRARR